VVAEFFRIGHLQFSSLVTDRIDRNKMESNELISSYLDDVHNIGNIIGFSVFVQGLVSASDQTRVDSFLAFEGPL
jgi:hypothetical protein